MGINPISGVVPLANLANNSALPLGANHVDNQPVENNTLNPFNSEDGVLPLSGEQGLLNPDILPLQAGGFRKLTGSRTAFINKSSYSGVDIKVVVHIYDNGKANEDRVRLLKDNIESIQSILDGLDRDISVNHHASLTEEEVIGLRKELAIADEEFIRLQNSNKSGFSTKVLAELQTISVSTHREKYPVRALGSVYPKSFTRGPRTIAGSMIFTVFDRNVLEQFLESHPSDFDAHNPATTALIDQLPPFDITIVFANELGQVSRMTIYGVEFVNEGQTMSIEDLLLENVCQYVARDIDPMRGVGQRKIDENNRLSGDMGATRASSLLLDDNYKKYKDLLDPFNRFNTRQDFFK